MHEDVFLVIGDSSFRSKESVSSVILIYIINMSVESVESVEGNYLHV